MRKNKWTLFLAVVLYMTGCTAAKDGSGVLETDDGGRSFSVVRDLPEEIEGYPQGFSFAGNEGYIAVFL